MNNLNRYSVPNVVIARLPIYLRELERLQNEQYEMVSSRNLAKRVMMSAPQIRRDLNHFGDLGRQGYGYPVDDLIVALRQILNAHRRWAVVVVGVGKLGKALICSKRLEAQGFETRAIFDNNPQKIGWCINGLCVEHINNLPMMGRSLNCPIGIICTPNQTAQSVANCLIEANVRCILNYAPATLIVPEHVQVQYVDPVVSLQQMTYHLATDIQPPLAIQNGAMPVFA